MLTVKEEIIDKITEVIYLMLNGKEPKNIELPSEYPDNEIKQVISYLNKFIIEYNLISDFMNSLATGEIDFTPTKSKMKVAQSFKHLRSNLKHLTWKTQQIANGDLLQKVDFMGDFSTAFNKMTQQLKEAFDKIENQKQELINANDIISAEKVKSENLLLNILPVKVAAELKHNGKTEPELFENVSVFFSDIVGFTHQSSKISPHVLIAELSKMFSVFDNIMEKNNCERIKTIGDAYLAVCGMHTPNKEHAKNIVNSALEIREYISSLENSSMEWEIRIGIHSGNVVGGVVGIKKYIYDVFGDTINTASRMESHSIPMHINISETTHNLIKSEYDFIEREPVEVKGKGFMKMFFVENKKIAKNFN